MSPRRFSHQVFLGIACLNAGLHVAGLVLAAWGMRPGTPLLPLVDRSAYLASYPLGWQLGWGVWMLCVPAVIAFFVLASERLASPLARLAVGLAIAGGAIDLCCDTIFLLVFPSLAARGPSAEILFLTMERGTGAVSLIVANGFYSAASLVLTFALRGRCHLGVILMGYGVAFFGTLLAAAGFTGVPWHVEWATGPTIGLYCVWVVLTARALCVGERA